MLVKMLVMSVTETGKLTKNAELSIRFGNKIETLQALPTTAAIKNV